MEAIAEKRKTGKEIEADIVSIREKLMDLTESKLTIMEKEYNLRDWITLKDYSLKYDIKPARLSNWMDRGIIPDDSLIVIPELNDLKLIKDKPYQARRYNARAVRAGSAS